MIKQSLRRALILGVGLLPFVGGFGPISQVAAAQDAAPMVSFDGVQNHGELYAKFAMAPISEVASEMGFGLSVLSAPDGTFFFGLTDENGAQIVLRPLVCEGQSFLATCNALLMSVVLSGFPNTNLARVNGYNDAQFFGRGHIIDGDKAVLSRMLIGEYGVVKGNLAIEIYSFRSAAYNFARYLASDQLSEAPGSPDLGGPGRGIGHGALPGQPSLENGAVTLAMPGLSLGGEETAGIDALVETLKSINMLDSYTNDISLMVKDQ